MNLSDKTGYFKKFSDKICLIITLMILFGLTAKGQINSESIKNKPLRLGIIGLVHDHGVFQSAFYRSRDQRDQTGQIAGNVTFVFIQTCVRCR